jgi:hypothetical protein
VLSLPGDVAVAPLIRPAAALQGLTDVTSNFGVNKAVV